MFINQPTRKIAMIIALIKSLFVDQKKSELETFIEAHQPQTIEEVEFWMAEYDHRKRFASKLRSEGRYNQADYLMFS